VRATRIAPSPAITKPPPAQPNAAKAVVRSRVMVGIIDASSSLPGRSKRGAGGRPASPARRTRPRRRRTASEEPDLLRGVGSLAVAVQRTAGTASAASPVWHPQGSAPRHRGVVEHHHLVDERGPVLADHMDVDLLGELRALGLGLDAHQARAGVDLRARAHRAHEAELVGAVVGRVPVAGELPAGAPVQAREEAQRQEAVRDRAAERALPFGALHVDVDPLVVPGELGKAVDHLLGDLDRLAPRAEGDADLALELLDVVEADLVHDGVLPAERPGRRGGPALPTPPRGRTEGAHRPAWRVAPRS